MTLAAASLFSGIGGSSLGYRAAGFEVVYANEVSPVARETYELNLGLAPDGRGVQNVSGADILDAVEAATGRRELHVLDASPPCQSWSVAGKRMYVHDANGRLYLEAIRLVDEARPWAFAIENVKGLAMGPARAYLRDFVEALRVHGYAAVPRVLRADLLGVPQRRERLVLLGVRADLGLDPRECFPGPQGRTVIGDALPHARRLVRLAKPPTWPEEASWHADDPAPTATTGGLGNFSHDRWRVETHDGGRHGVTIGELAALCGFPEDFTFAEHASFGTRWRGLGNAVPPPMARAWAEGLASALRTLTT